MNITFSEQGNVTVVHLEGKLDFACCQEFKTAIKVKVNDQKVFLLLNFEKVEFVVSEVLGALIGLMAKLQEKDGRLTMSNLPEKIAKKFQFTKLDTVFEIYPTVEEALASYQQ